MDRNATNMEEKLSFSVFTWAWGIIETKKGQISEEVVLKKFVRRRMDDYARSVHATQLSCH